MGVLLWIDEPGLRDTVVLNPIEVFVKEIVMIICNLNTAADINNHEGPEHKLCQRLHWEAWLQLRDRGVLDSKLLPVLLARSERSGQLATVVALMVKFGLVVPLLAAPTAAAGARAARLQYIVPALLPPVSAAEWAPAVQAQWTARPCCTCFFAFTTSGQLATGHTSLSAETLRRQGFLPAGLFERLLGKAIAWCRETTPVLSVLDRLSREQATLCFGSQCFRLTSLPAMNCIRLDVEGSHPLPMLARLSGQVQAILDECFQALTFFTVLQLAAPHAAVAGAVEAAVFLPLVAVTAALPSDSLRLERDCGGGVLHGLLRLFPHWLVDSALLPLYHIFISYRWNRLDLEFADQLFDALTNHTVGRDHRAIDVFLDRKRLKDGRNFQADFVKALVAAQVVVVLLSVDALGRMVKHDPAAEDNLLVEWIISLLLYESKNCIAPGGAGGAAVSAAGGGIVLERIFPVLFGPRDRATGASSDFFKASPVTALPTCVPTASLERALLLLRDAGVDVAALPPSVLDKTRRRGVQETVAALLTFQCFKAWEAPAAAAADQAVAVRAAQAAVDVLRGCPGLAGQRPPSGSGRAAVKALTQTVDGTPQRSGGGGGSGGRKLESLTSVEVAALLGEHKDLAACCAKLQEVELSGELLSECESMEELRELGLVAVHARKLFKLAQEWKLRLPG